MGRGRRASAAALRALAANYPTCSLILRADLEIGRGRFDAARAHLAAAAATLREDRRAGIYDVYLAELALWERRWAEAADAVRDGLALARSRHAEPRSVSGCAPRDCARRRSWPRSHAPVATPTPLRGARPRRHARRDGPRSGRRGRRGHAERRRLAAPWPKPNTTAPAAAVRPDAVGDRRRALGPARAPAARGLLPLARGRGARRGRRAARRGDGAAARRARRRRTARRAAPAARDRVPRRTRAARSYAGYRAAPPTRPTRSMSSG